MLRYFASGPVQTNTYLLFCPDTRQGAIIDVPFGSAEAWLQWTQEQEIQVAMILLTHSHWDHIAEAALLQGELKAPLYVHGEDQGNLKQPGSDRLPRPSRFPGTNPDGLLVDGQVLSLGNLSIEVIHTPGHTPGGVCFYLPAPPQPILLSGDTLFRGSIGNLSFPTSSPDRMWESLRRLSTLDPDTQIFPGHGDPTTLREELPNINNLLEENT